MLLLLQPRTSSSDTMARFNEEAGSAFIRRQKVINHPGEVNKLREFPHLRNVVVTHTDAPEVCAPFFGPWGLSTRTRLFVWMDPRRGLGVAGLYAPG